MTISSASRYKIRGNLTAMGYKRTGYTNVSEPGGEYSETWTDGNGESVVLTWDGYPTVNTPAPTEAAPPLSTLVIEHADAIRAALYDAKNYRLENIGTQGSEPEYLRAEARLEEIQALIPILEPALRSHIRAG